LLFLRYGAPFQIGAICRPDRPTKAIRLLRQDRPSLNRTMRYRPAVNPPLRRQLEKRQKPIPHAGQGFRRIQVLRDRRAALFQFLAIPLGLSAMLALPKDEGR